MSEGLPPLREVIAAAGLSANRALGQNFLLDLNLTAKIVRSAGDLTGATVIEIGPGPGGLTRALIDSKAARIIAVEQDRRFAAALDPLVARAPDRLEILWQDALETDVARLGGTPRLIIANLPYNIATPLLLRWLKASEHFTAMILMFQAEVAERLTARPGTRAYGRLSVMAQWRARIDRVLDLPPAAFTPPPKVSSRVVRLIPIPVDPALSFSAMETVVAAAFGQRRKMLRRALAVLERGEALLAIAGIDPTRRAESLTVAEFEWLARAWQSL